MDPKGARELTKRIGERQWRLAAAVQRSEQPPEDPHADHLEEVGEGYRLYRIPNGNAEPMRMRKVLVDGFWREAPVGDAGPASDA